MGEGHRRRPAALPGLIAGSLTLVTMGCSSPKPTTAVSPTAPPTTPALAPEPIKSLGPPLPKGPTAPPTSSSLSPPTSSSGPAGPSVSSTHDPSTPDCPASDLASAASTDHPSYRDGDPVNVSVSVTNSGGSTCQYQPHPLNGGVVVQQSGGRPVWEPRRGTQAPSALWYRLAPHRPAVVISVSWDQRSCPPPCTSAEGTRVQPGAYRAVPQLSTIPSVQPAAFKLL